MNTTTYGTGTGPRAQQAQRDAAERERLAEDLARWAGQEAEAAHDEAVASVEGRHGTYCCMHAREDGARNEHAFAMSLPLDKLRRRHAAELEERAVERAKREGVL